MSKEEPSNVVETATPLGEVMVTHFAKWLKIQELGPRIIETHLPPSDDEDDDAPPIPKITVIKKNPYRHPKPSNG
jgi:hypothetical protein